ncbi:hypothetical protein HMPREF1870_02193 [Bacteroidales bacterium KA00344]|nr:hypothetical protein HMPREF1870_02193 [Bacteroidales bacterium KA00344]
MSRFIFNSITNRHKLQPLCVTLKQKYKAMKTKNNLPETNRLLLR